MIGAALTVVPDILEALLGWWFKRRNSQIPDVLNAIACIYKEMNTALSTAEGCVRVVLLKTENGGGIPQLGSELKSSVVHEVWAAEVKNVSGNWIKQRLDEQYILNLLEINKSPRGEVTLPASAFKGSVLQHVYALNHVQTCHLAEIARRKHAYYYLSFNYVKPADGLTDQDHEAMRSCILYLRNVFKKQKELG